MALLERHESPPGSHYHVSQVSLECSEPAARRKSCLAVSLVFHQLGGSSSEILRFTGQADAAAGSEAAASGGLDT